MQQLTLTIVEVQAEFDPDALHWQSLVPPAQSKVTNKSKRCKTFWGVGIGLVINKILHKIKFQKGKIKNDPPTS
jgi:hypothetical protein